MENKNFELLKCPICGHEMEKLYSFTYKCPACGTKKTYSTGYVARFVQFCIAENEIRNRNFDSAQMIYRQILSEEEIAEAYWGLFICDFELSYVVDENLHRKPIFNNIINSSVFSNENFLKASRLASESQEEEYRKAAKEVEKIRLEIIEQTQNTEYDVFLCQKINEIADSKHKTEEFEIALDLYYKLKELGYKVFFSEKTLVGGIESDASIFTALNKSKTMIVIGSSKENLESVWVKTEWTRFLFMIDNGIKEKGSIMPIITNNDLSSLPSKLSRLQFYSRQNPFFIEKIEEFLNKFCNVQNSKEIERAYQLAKIELEEGAFKEAEKTLTKIINESANQYEAYFLRAMAKAHCNNRTQFEKCSKKICKEIDFKRLLTMFSNESLPNEVEEILALESKRKERRRRFAPIVKCAIAFSISIILSFSQFFILNDLLFKKTSQYFSAINQMRSGEYQEAYEKFNGLDGFAKSEVYLNAVEIQLKRDGFKVLSQKEYASGELENAMKLLTLIGESESDLGREIKYRLSNKEENLVSLFPMNGNVENVKYVKPDDEGNINFGDVQLENSGEKLIGWSENKDNQVRYELDETVNISQLSNKRLYAVWSEIEGKAREYNSETYSKAYTNLKEFIVANKTLENAFKIEYQANRITFEYHKSTDRIMLHTSVQKKFYDYEPWVFFYLNPSLSSKEITMSIQTAADNAFFINFQLGKEFTKGVPFEPNYTISGKGIIYEKYSDLSERNLTIFIERANMGISYICQILNDEVGISPRKVGFDFEEQNERKIFYVDKEADEDYKQTFNNEAFIKLEKNKFDKSDYVFAGWAKSQDGAPKYLNEERVDFENEGIYRLYPVWIHEELWKTEE